MNLMAEIWSGLLAHERARLQGQLCIALNSTGV